MKRRDMLNVSMAATAGTFIRSPLPGLDVGGSQGLQKPLKVLVAGAHPDDPETGCGGTIIRYANAGHKVAVFYLTRGEAGIPGKSHEEAATIRTKELNEACRIMQARPLFGGQIDGDTFINREQYEKTLQMLQDEKPDIIFTHWPVDTHPDHRVCSELIYGAWLEGGQKAALYFFEVETGYQSQNFLPTDYCDISAVVREKHEACFVHRSQKIREAYPDDHGIMEKFRGREAGCRYAEAFICHMQSPYKNLPGR